MGTKNPDHPKTIPIRSRKYPTINTIETKQTSTMFLFDGGGGGT